MIPLLALGYASLGLVVLWINPLDVRRPTRWFAVPFLIAIWPIVLFAYLNDPRGDQ